MRQSRLFAAMRFIAIRVAIVTLLCVILGSSLLGWSLPVAANPLTKRVEEQILQVIRDHPEAIIDSVQAYQQQQREQLQQVQQAVLQQMKVDPAGIIGQSPTTGAPEPKIVLVEFSDFQCPYCADAHKTLQKFMDTHANDVTLVYKHFPLSSLHSEAGPAAQAAWAASQQGKFWQYQDALFTQQDKLGEALYTSTAQKLELDMEQFNRDRQSEGAASQIAKDMTIAEQLGISGTPFFVMNGEIFSGAVSLPNLEQALTRANNARPSNAVS